MMSSSPRTKVFVSDQHASNILEKLQTFYKDQQLFDIALTTKTDSIKVNAHRNILCASSDYLLAMLGSTSTLKEVKSDVLELEVDGATLQMIVDFMYSGSIELRSENVENIFKAADVLKMDTLKVACHDFFSETIDVANCLDIAFLSNQEQPAEIIEKAFQFALQHFKEVRKNEHFPLLTENQLLQLLDRCVDSQEAVFHSLAAWVKYDKRNREERIPTLLSHVPYQLLSIDFIRKNLHTISKTFQCSHVLFKWMVPLLKLPTSEWKKANGTRLGFIVGQYTDNLKCWTLDPESNTWFCEDLPPAPTRKDGYTATVIENKLIISGGWTDSCATRIVECLDLQTKEWTNLPSMLQQRDKTAMVELKGDLYIVGGRSEGIWSSSLEKYDFRTRKWQELAPMPISERYVTATVVGELLYAVGKGNSPIKCYNPANNEWTQISHKNERSTEFGIAGVAGHLYAVGGRHNGEASKTVERYDSIADTWTEISPSLQLGLRNLLCVSCSNRLIVCRGFDGHNELSNLVKEYNPESNEWKTLAALAFENPLMSESIVTFTK